MYSAFFGPLRDLSQVSRILLGPHRQTWIYRSFTKHKRRFLTIIYIQQKWNQPPMSTHPDKNNFPTSDFCFDFFHFLTIRRVSGDLLNRQYLPSNFITKERFADSLSSQVYFHVMICSQAYYSCSGAMAARMLGRCLIT